MGDKSLKAAVQAMLDRRRKRVGEMKGALFAAVPGPEVDAANAAVEAYLTRLNEIEPTLSDETAEAIYAEICGTRDDGKAGTAAYNALRRQVDDATPGEADRAPKVRDRVSKALASLGRIDSALGDVPDGEEKTAATEAAAEVRSRLEALDLPPGATTADQAHEATKALRDVGNLLRPLQRELDPERPKPEAPEQSIKVSGQVSGAGVGSPGGG